MKLRSGQRTLSRVKSVGEKNSIFVMTMVLFRVATASGEVSGMWLDVMKRVFVGG